MLIIGSTLVIIGLAGAIAASIVVVFFFALLAYDLYSGRNEHLAAHPRGHLASTPGVLARPRAS